MTSRKWWLSAAVAWAIVLVLGLRVAESTVVPREAVQAGDVIAELLAESAGERLDLRARPVSTLWLENGLRIVTVENDEPKWVSIRLIVEDGYLRVPAERVHFPHLVEHCVFREVMVPGDARSWARRIGVISGAYTEAHRVWYEFDVPLLAASPTLQSLRAQWDAGAFPKTQFERERDRVRHEVRTLYRNPVEWNLATEFAPGTVMDRSHGTERVLLDSVTREDAWRHFTHTYVGDRMTLLIVATRDVLIELGPDLEAFSSIPEGTAAEPLALGNLSWLNGLMGQQTLLADNAMGMWFPQPSKVTPWERQVLARAADTYLTDRLCLGRGYSYDAEFTRHEGSDAALWIWEPRTDFVIHSRNENFEAAREALEWLGRPEALEWWKAYLQGLRAEDRMWYRYPMPIADELSRLVAQTPHYEPLVDVFPPALPAPVVALRKYDEISTSGHWFSVASASFDRKTEGEEARESALFMIAWLLTEWEEANAPSFYIGMALICVLLYLMVALVTHAVARRRDLSFLFRRYDLSSIGRSRS
jgi:hypothetical protein